MKKSLPFLTVPIMLFALSQGLRAQEQTPKYLFQGTERLNSKAGFRYVYDVPRKLKAAVYYDAKGNVPHVDSIYYDEQGRINRVDQYQVLSGEIPDPLPLDTRFQYTYDEKGRVHERIMYYGYALDNPAGKKELIYDEHGNNIIIRTYLLSIGKTVDMRYVYNEKNQLIKSGYPSDEDPNKITTNIKTYEYDENGYLIKENSYTDEPNPMLNGYVQYTYKDNNLTDMLLMDINPETTAEDIYLIFKFDYNMQAMGKEAFYPAYPFSYDGPMFHNSMVEDALTTGNLRTTMISTDPDAEEGKKETTYAYLYKNNDPASIERVGAAKDLKAYKNGGVLTIEGYRISKTSVYDMSGKVVANVDAQTDRIDIPVESLGRGVFVVVAQNAKGQKMNVKVIL